MNKAQRDIRRKKRVLEHAARIGNVRKTCRYFGVARSGFYRWKEGYETHGDEGLINKKPCPYNPRLRTLPEIVEKVVGGLQHHGGVDLQQSLAHGSAPRRSGGAWRECASSRQ